MVAVSEAAESPDSPARSTPPTATPATPTHAHGGHVASECKNCLLLEEDLGVLSLQVEQQEDMLSLHAEEAKATKVSFTRQTKLIEQQQSTLNVQAEEAKTMKDSLRRQAELLMRHLGKSEAIAGTLCNTNQPSEMQQRLLHETGLLVTAVESLIETRHAKELAML